MARVCCSRYQAVRSSLLDSKLRVVAFSLACAIVRNCGRLNVRLEEFQTSLTSSPGIRYGVKSSPLAAGLGPDPFEDAVSQGCEVTVAISDSFTMRSNSSVCGLQKEHRLSRFHCQWHQTSIIPQSCHAVRIILHAQVIQMTFLCNRFAVFRGNSIHPSLVCFHRAVGPVRVLHYYVPHWLHFS